MGTVANPLYANLVPGMNPTGNQVSLGGAVPGSPSSGANTFLPQAATSTSPTAPVTTNPFMGGAVPGAPSPGAVPVTAPGINTGGYSSSGGTLLPSGGTNATGGKAT